MNWIIPLGLLLLAIALWRWSFRADDRLVAASRWCLAVFVLLLDLVYVAGMLAQRALS